MTTTRLTPRPAAPVAVAQTRAILADLQPRLAGEARFDLYTRTLYATDASIYQVMPLGVVMPRSADDVQAALEVARRHDVPIVARGGGSSLAGQAIGPGIVIDFSKYMNRIVTVSPETRRARVQPGVALDPFNRQLAAHGLKYGPDPASSNRATFGGMIGNDSTGAHSILYGMTHDNVESLRLLLADGSATELGPMSAAALEARRRRSDLDGAIHRTMFDLAARHRDEIARRFPPHWRAVSGYGLDRLVGQETPNLAPFLVGSEGTLALTVEATVRLVPTATRSALAVVHFATLDAAMAATPRLLEVEPAAIELIDDLLLSLTREVPEYARMLTFVEGTPAAILIVEFYGESDAELEAGFARLRAQLKRLGSAGVTIEIRDPRAIAEVWAVRKAGIGLLMANPAEWKPVPFIEDGAVPPEELATFVREMKALLAAHDVRAAFFAHASAGCLHIRPLLNLKRAEDVARLRAIGSAWADLIVRLRGAPSGEHGDGRARSEWNQRLFGETLYDAFRTIKKTWDPEGRLNPGIIVDPDPMDENLRYGADYSAAAPPTVLSFEATGGLLGAVEMCSGIGSCRKQGDGVMCPSFMATLDERDSTRGRANALRAAFNGMLPADALTSPEMAAVLDLCLECKACAVECPSQVDMAKIKYEFLHHYYQAHRPPLRHRLFGGIRTLSRLGSRLAPVSNWLVRGPQARLAQRLLGIAPERSLPPFASPDFAHWFAEHTPHANAGLQGEVALFPDTFTLYHYPEMGIAAVRLIEAAGYRVRLPAPLGCCGRPMISKGMLTEARETLAHNVAALLPHVRAGRPVIGIEPSCLLTFRDEAPDLLRSREAGEVAAGALLIDEWLADRAAAGTLEPISWRGGERRLLLHGHCHHKAAGIDSALRALNLPPGYEATLIDAGCCGMAGSFGFEAEHYALSRRIGQERLFPALAADPDAGVAVTGVSCRQQIAHFTDRRPRHLVEWLADDLA